MRVVLQRVKRARVVIDGQETASIGNGFVLLVGISRGDTKEIVERIAGKISRLRIFDDVPGRMDLDIKSVNGEILSVSQFTLLGDVSHGNRPGFDGALEPGPAKILWELFNASLERAAVPVRTGEFGEHMDLDIVNDGPVTFVVES